MVKESSRGWHLPLLITGSFDARAVAAAAKADTASDPSSPDPPPKPLNEAEIEPLATTNTDGQID